MPPRLKSLRLNGIVVGEYLGSDDPEEDLKAARDLLRAKGLDNPPSQVDVMLTQANAFAYVANECYKKLMERQGIDKRLVAPPFVVNAAFSIELYLKTLHAFASGTEARGHKLLDLFDALADQQRIDLQAESVNLAAQHGEGADTKIRELIAMLNDAFVQWRYVYELPRTGMIHFQRAILAMHACRDVCARGINARKAARP